MRQILTGVAVAMLLTATAPALATTEDGVDVTGSVWLDLDGDGTQDDDEPGRAGVQVTLRTSATILDAVATDESGTWTFGNVPPGTYVLTVATPIDLEVTGGTLVGLDRDEGTGSITVGNADVSAGSIGLGSGVSAGPDVTATISLDREASTPELYVWRVAAYNIGPETATGPVEVRVVLNAGHTAQSVSGDGWECDESDAILLCGTGGDLAAATGLPSLRVISVPTGDIGTEVTATATVRLDGVFDAAPLNDEASATVVISSEIAAADIDGDGEGDLTNAGAPVALLALAGVTALGVGAAAVRTQRRT